MISGLADRLATLAAWRRVLAGVALGVLATLALPPWGVVPLLLPAFAGLLWLAAGRAPIAAALAGWSFGFGFFGSGLYWVAESMLVEADKFAWLIPFALASLAGGLALFPAAVLGGLAWLEAKGAVAGLGRVPAFAALWTLAEWLRGWVLTGFPWQLVGYAWADTPMLRQGAALIGVFGLTLVTVVVAALPALWGRGRSDRRAPWLAAGAGALLAALAAFGAVRLAEPPPAGAGAPIRIVQGNVEQQVKWQPERRFQFLQLYRELSLQPPQAGPPPRAIVWPETAVAYFLAEDAEARAAALAGFAPGTLLLTGTPRTDLAPDGRRRFFNSLVAIEAPGGGDAPGRVVASYDKAHLVPFGEYVPLRGILPFERLVPSLGDFTPGPGRVTWRLPDLPPASPLICYEIIFPGQALDAADRPAWLLNVTNDGWFGTSAGPYQHLAIARLRAVEEGVPLLRAAGTGISAAIDALGRTVGSLPLGTRGVLDVALPPPLPTPPLFARTGNALPLGLALLALALAAWLSRRPAS